MSDVYQVMSDCAIAFNTIKKINETQFPLPFAQICFVALHALVLLLPLTMTTWIDGVILSATLSFVFVWIFFAINFTAASLEQPFGKCMAASGKYGTLPLSTHYPLTIHSLSTHRLVTHYSFTIHSSLVSAHCLPLRSYSREIQADLCSLLHPHMQRPGARAEQDKANADPWPHNKWHRYFSQLQKEAERDNSACSQGQDTANVMQRAFFASEGSLEEGHVALLDEVREDIETIGASSLPRVSDLNSAVQNKKHKYAVAP